MNRTNSENYRMIFIKDIVIAQLQYHDITEGASFWCPIIHILRRCNATCKFPFLNAVVPFPMILYRQYIDITIYQDSIRMLPILT